MTAFERVWALLKTDMKLPRPNDVPKYTDPHANLAVHGSLNPYWQQYPDTNFETFDETPEGMTQFHQSIKDEIDRRSGKLIEPADSPWKYDVGDFSEEMKDGEDSGWGGPATAGIAAIYDEIERASVVEGINDAGIWDEEEIARVLDEWNHVEGLGFIEMMQGQRKTTEMNNGRGRMVNRLEDYHDFRP